MNVIFDKWYKFGPKRLSINGVLQLLPGSLIKNMRN